MKPISNDYLRLGAFYHFSFSQLATCKNI